MPDKLAGRGRFLLTSQRLGGGAAVLLLLASVPNHIPAAAQDVDCAALKAQIDATSGGAGRAGQFASALRQQQFEVERTQNYADSIGCNSGFLFGGGPPQCDTISARIERMQANIEQMRRQLQADGEDGYQRRALTEQYNSFCRAVPPQGATDEPAPGQPLMPVDPDAPPSPDMGPADTGGQPHPSQVKALCVRHCDGGFFPITDTASSDSLDRLGELCKALCPNTEASLYTTSPSGGIETAVAPDGAPYTALPAAFKYQKTFDPSCSCKPPHQTWVEALANAEKLIQSDKGDVTVTQKMSDAMSRPVAPGSSSAARPPKKTKTARKPKQRSPADAAPNLADQGNAPTPENPGEDITRQFRRSAPTL